MSETTINPGLPSPHLSFFPTMPAVIPPTSRLNFIKNWWQRSPTTALHAEGRLLQRMIPTPNNFVHPVLNKYQNQQQHYRPLIARSINVPINNGAHIINTFTLSPLSSSDTKSPLVWDANTTINSENNQSFKEEKTNNNLVICHGYGAGLGFFYK